MFDMPNYFLGIDLGTSYTKALIIDHRGLEVALASVETHWSESKAGAVAGQADLFVQGFYTAVTSAIAKVEQSCGKRIKIEAIGIAGLAESGVLLNAAGEAISPVIAWFDERGEDQMNALSANFKSEFSRKTGLIFTSQCSLGKWLWLKDNGFDISPNTRWLNLLEYIAYRLTGEVFTEPSLASRTGGWAQETDSPWQPALDLIGASEKFFPEVKRAGEAFGRVLAKEAPAQIRNSIVTVAGHDHAVASVGAGAVGNDVLFNSCGTADVLFRSISGKLTDEARAELVLGGIGAGTHVLAGKSSLIGGTRGGLVLRRILSLFDEFDDDVRFKLDLGWVDNDDQSIVVTEPQFMANEINISITNETSAQQLWNAAIRHNSIETKKVLSHMSKVVGEHSSARAAGGWTRLRSIRLSKQALMPDLSFSETNEPGAFGAANFAIVASNSSLANSSIEDQILDLVLDGSNERKK